LDEVEKKLGNPPPTSDWSYTEGIEIVVDDEGNMRISESATKLATIVASLTAGIYLMM